jgi:hypothetical protein
MRLARRFAGEGDGERQPAESKGLLAAMGRTGEELEPGEPRRVPQRNRSSLA